MEQKNTAEITIIGMNDINASRLLPLVKNLLIKRGIKCELVDACSTYLNKTEDIDSLLKANFSIEQIKLMQRYSIESSIKKYAFDNNLPDWFGQAIGKIVSNRGIINKDNDKRKYMTQMLYDARNAVVLYSSGINNLMREIQSDPIKLLKDYNSYLKTIKKERKKESDLLYFPIHSDEKTKDYYLTSNRIVKPNVLDPVMDGIKRNFDNILYLNSNAIIYGLGAYLPTNIAKNNVPYIKELIDQYNGKYQQCIKEFGLNYVDLSQIKTSSLSFVAPTNGLKQVAELISDDITIDKLNCKNQKRNSLLDFIYPEDTEGYIIDLRKQIDRLCCSDDCSIAAQDRDIVDCIDKKLALEIIRKTLKK